ncbi:MAG: hypothetical protein ACOYXA_13800 [Bacteroidota bacterium]
MNLVKIIEAEHSAAQRDRIVRYVGHDADRFRELVNVFLAGPYRVTQRASWPQSVCVQNHPHLMLPHLKTLLLQLQKPRQHNAVKRNIVRLLQFVDIPERLQGLTVQLCFNLLQDGREPVAIRVFAMTVLANLAENLPELKNELIPFIEDQLPYQSAGFVSRGRKLLAKWRRQPKSR